MNKYLNKKSNFYTFRIEIAFSHVHDEMKKLIVIDLIDIFHIINLLNQLVMVNLT